MDVSFWTKAGLVLSCMIGLGSAAVAQSALAPDGKPGELVYIPYPVAINLDGKADDWAGIKPVVVTSGPTLSKNPAENGSFSFRLAADAENLYIQMTSVDTNLITGTHGADYWNEDSLEFYLNLGASFGLSAYNADVAQYRVLPKDIGNADPAAITQTGTNIERFPLKARVFKTADGWGFEGAIRLAAKITPAHGREIGFQAQANGASDKDRNVKLIWSRLDKADNSWQNPSLFGRAIFYQIGKTDAPQASVASAPTPVEAPSKPVISPVALNQTGYFPGGIKTASLAKPGAEKLKWQLLDATSLAAVASGLSAAGVGDAVSGDTVHLVDFSAFNKAGNYIMEIDGQRSSVFRIGTDLMGRLRRDSLAYFYRNRSGIELTADLAGAAWARPAGHLSDAKTPAYTGYSYLINGLGGWYDAGDFGKYLVNGGIAVWTLQNAYERNPAAFKDGDLAIPESRNGQPDILDEARWELAFMLNMQIPAGQPLAGMAFHKLHDKYWSGVPTALPSNFKGERYVYEPSTAATLNLAATAAQASRLWKKLDPAFASQCLSAARSAWKAARANPRLIAGNVPGSGGGNYDDVKVSDDFYWAAAELLASTGEAEFLDFVRTAPEFASFPGLATGASSSMSWADTAALGSISLALGTVLPKADLDRLKAQIAATADRYLKISGSEGYRVPMAADGYVWGSCSVVLNNALILGLAFDFTKKPAYRDGVVHAMDWILGFNALSKSFVSGYGSNPLSHPHHRVWGNDPAAGYPAPPPGALAGGPNASIQDPAMEAARLADVPVAKRYLDTLASYATNEVAINWNAPLAWVSSWLDQQFNGR